MKKAMSLFLCVLFIASLSGCTKKVMYPEYTKLPFYLHALSEATVADTKQSVSSESKYFQLDLDETMKEFILSVKLPENIIAKAYADMADGSTAAAENPRYIFSINNIPVGECIFNTLELPENAERLSKESKTINHKIHVTKMNLKCKSEDKNWELPVYRIQAFHISKSYFAVLYFRQDVFTYDQILKIAKSTQFHYKQSLTRAGEVGTDKTCNILVLGNSFLMTSQLDLFLGEMQFANQGSMKYKVVSEGFADVTTYAANQEILNEMQSGEYDAFSCADSMPIWTLIFRRY